MSKIEDYKERIYDDHLRKIRDVIEDIEFIIKNENQNTKNIIYNFVSKTINEFIEETRN